MIAYNKKWLHNLFIQQQVEDALQDNVITKEEKNNIGVKYSAPFYSPDFFIRLGLFVLTIIILLFSFGLLLLIFLSSIDKTIAGLTIFFGLLSYAALEITVSQKKHYQSGVDDALLWTAAGCLFGGISYATGAGALSNCFIIFMIALFCTIRFADRLMAAAAFISLLGILFYAFTSLGNTGKAMVPFILMAVSALIYFIFKKINDPQRFNEYSGCVEAIEILTLISLYVAGNYFVVRELSNSIFYLNLQKGESIPFGWLFWIFTLFIPAIYLFAGIKMKDMVLIRVSLLLVAAMVFTIRYYHFIVAVETGMCIGGMSLILIAWALTRYLQTPKYGFTSVALKPDNNLDKMHIESLILAETFTQHGIDSGETKFGGGSFGGGGATGEF